VIVWLVRHGDAGWPPGAALGWSDPPLTARGRAQAAAVGRRLAGRPLAAVHSSDLRRARATAEAVAAPHGLRVLVSEDLRELGFGAWEGRLLSDLWRELPEEARRWEADLRRSPPQFAESVPDLERRVAAFARALRGGAIRGEEVAVVAHRGSLAALHGLLSGEDLASSFRRLPLAHAQEVRVAC
jgi:broad specificity phosphatase PhoE